GRGRPRGARARRAALSVCPPLNVRPPLGRRGGGNLTAMRLAAALALSLAAARPSAGAGLRVEVRDASGDAVADAVVYAIPEGRKIPPPTRPAVIDQKNR